VFGQLRHWRNTQLVDQLGDNTLVRGAIEKRGARSRIYVGRDSIVDGRLVTEAPDAQIRIGSNTSIGGATLLAAVKEIIVEDDVLISYECIITDSDNHNVGYSRRKNDLHEWMAGAVCGMASVVTKDVAPYTIVAGNPARVIRELGPDER
jgi:acetyltransferase-like isoleucine patch superfamily enzyme